MTNPQDSIVMELRKAHEHTLGADKVITRVMYQGNTWEAVQDAIGTLVSAGLVKRGGGRLTLVED